MEKEWRVVPGYDKYLCSSDGNVMREATGLILKQYYGASSMYPSVGLYDAESRHNTMSVHRIIASAFIGERPAGMQVNHKDGNRENNNITNLEYVLPKENMQHAIITGLRNDRGENSSCSKLNNEKVAKIRMLLHDGVTMTEIASIYDVSRGTIYKIKNKLLWAHVKENADLASNGFEEHKLMIKKNASKIRDLANSNKYNRAQIASMFDICEQTVSRIKNMKVHSEV